MYSLQDLVTAVTVADAGSIRAAAAALGRTQPAITQAIRRLEAEAGFPLLDRSAYRASLTSQGRAFVDRARPLLKQLVALRDFGVLLSSGVEPRLRMAIDSATPGPAWTGLLQGVSERFPETIMEIEADEGLAPLRRLSEGRADLAIVFDAVLDQAGTTVERIGLGEAGFSTIVRADRRDALDGEGAAFPQILVADFERSDPEFGRLEAQNYWRVNGHPLQLTAIAAGLGWGCVPEGLADNVVGEKGLVAVAHMGLRQRSCHRFSLCRRRGRTLGPVGTLIWESASGQLPA